MDKNVFHLLCALVLCAAFVIRGYRKNNRVGAYIVAIAIVLIVVSLVPTDITPQGATVLAAIGGK